MAYGIDPTLQTSATGGGIDPATGETFGEIMAKNSTNQALQEQQVNLAAEKVRQARIQTQVEEKQFDAQTYLSEKGLMTKEQAMAQLKIVMTLQEKPQEEIDRVMEIANEMLPDSIHGQGLYQWWTTLQLPKYKAERTYPTDEDIRRVRVDSAGNPLQKDIGYIVDAYDSWHRSGLSKMESEMQEKLRHSQNSSGAGGWKRAGHDENGREVMVNKDGVFRFGDTTAIGNVPILPMGSTMATGPTRTSAENAQTISGKIQKMRDLIANADQKGLVGPVVGRIYNQFLTGKVGSTGNSDADKLLGELRSMDTFMKSGAMKVHFGSRGGQQMYDHFKEILNTGSQSVDVLEGGLNGIQSFMEGYAHAPGVPSHPATTIPDSGTKHGRRATDQPAVPPAPPPATAPATPSGTWGIRRKQ